MTSGKSEKKVVELRKWQAAWTKRAWNKKPKQNLSPMTRHENARVSTRGLSPVGDFFDCRKKSKRVTTPLESQVDQFIL